MTHGGGNLNVSDLEALLRQLGMGSSAAVLAFVVFGLITLFTLVYSAFAFMVPFWVWGLRRRLARLEQALDELYEVLTARSTALGGGRDESAGEEHTDGDGADQ